MEEIRNGVAVRKAIDVTGIVQGVGFRPFVYRLAHDCNLTGFIANTPSGVTIEIQGGDASVENFARLFAEPGERDPAPDIDFLIRTGGEQRLSNCPLWEIAYTELYFTPCLWPDFTAADLDAALQDFYTRERRFGRIPAVFA